MVDGHRLQFALDCETERQALAQLALFEPDPHSYKPPSQRDAEARRQAQETAEKARQEAEACRRQDEHEAAHLDVASVARFLEHIKDRTAKYKKDTRYYLSAWADALQGRDLRKVEPRQVLRLLAQWDTAEQKRIADLKAFCSFLVKKELLDPAQDPSRTLTVPASRPEKTIREKGPREGRRTPALVRGLDPLLPGRGLKPRARLLRTCLRERERAGPVCRVHPAGRPGQLRERGGESGKGFGGTMTGVLPSRRHRKEPYIKKWMVVPALLAFLLGAAVVQGSMQVRVGAPPPRLVTGPWTPRAPLAGVLVCVDPGHGGEGKVPSDYYTGGSLGVVTGQTEGSVNLRVSLFLKKYLEEAGARVELTRLADVRCSQEPTAAAELACRRDFANAKDCDLFVSVHHDFVEGPDNATKVFFPDADARSLPLAQNVSTAVSHTLGTLNRGALPSSLAVLRELKMPAVLVEASRLSIPEEDRRLATEPHNQKEAMAITVGILNYLRLLRSQEVAFSAIYPPGTGMVEAQAVADATYIRTEVASWRFPWRPCEQRTYDIHGVMKERKFLGLPRLSANRSFSLGDLVTCR
ncbi:MAG TPA: N-acetylmuramoyl-L-alanine amidase [Myxococcus sp.]|nr:N-acetylmuramoyl-L-alanine amidase [Myxococcus sp.]